MISGYKGLMNALTTDIAIETADEKMNDLFTSGGMAGMLGETVFAKTGMNVSWCILACACAGDRLGKEGFLELRLFSRVCFV